MRKISKIALLFIISVILIVVAAIFLFGDDDIGVDNLKSKYADAESEYITVLDTEVHYKREGQGDPIVLLHGTGASLHTWDQWTGLLKDSFEVIRLDLPAFGITGPRPDRKYEISDYVAFVNAFAQAIDLDTFAIAGNSLGGCIGWNYVCKYESNVDKLILIDASGIPNNETPMVIQIGRTPILSTILKRLTPRSFIEKNITEVYYNDDLATDATITRYHEMTLREGNRQAFVDRCNIKTVLDTSCLRDISIPVLIQWGEHDEWITLENGEKLNTAIPNSQLKTYKSGHVPMEENPLETATDAIAFLKK